MATIHLLQTRGGNACEAEGESHADIDHVTCEFCRLIHDGITEFSDDELQAAQDWHGGQASMLYAVSSTGTLARGTIRPSERCDCNPSDRGCRQCQGRMRIELTDRAWFASLCERLSDEAEACAIDCETRIKRARRARRMTEVDELTSNLNGLNLLAERARLAAQGKALV